MPEGAETSQGTVLPRLGLDVDELRTRIKTSLVFEFQPIEGRGKARLIQLAEFQPTRAASIAGEMLVALWETSAGAQSSTVAKNLEYIRWFLRFLLDDDSHHSKAHQPTTIAELTFQAIRDFEHWRRDRPPITLSKVVENEAQLRSRLEHPLVVGNRGLVALSTLEKELGWPIGYFAKHSHLISLVKVAAEKIGSTIRMPRSPMTSRMPKTKVKVNSKQAESTYFLIAKLLRHMLKRGYGFAPGFRVPAISQVTPDGPVKTPALDGRERALLRKAAMRATRSIRTRLLVDGPAGVLRGHASPHHDKKSWAGSRDNALAFLAAAWPGAIPPKSDETWKAVKKGLGSARGAIDIAFELNPHAADLVPFVVLLGMSRHAPLNLSSILELQWCPDRPELHCIYRSPTANHARIFFGKPRSGVDRDFIDVPDRSEFDIPGLIRTVASLTSAVRNRAAESDRDILWHYLGEKGSVHQMSAALFGPQLNKFLTKTGLQSSNPDVGIYFKRLRPTILSELTEKSGLALAQAAASHANPAQTLAYALNPTSNSRLSAAVAVAQSRAMNCMLEGFSNRPKNEEIVRLAGELQIPFGAALELVIGKRDKLFNGCIDDRNGVGPEPAGRKCGRFEACLVCANSVILERHLPRLIGYQNYWFSQIELMPPNDWNEEHAVNCAVVDHHLGRFAPEIVAAARACVEAAPPLIAYHRFRQL